MRPRGFISSTALLVFFCFLDLLESFFVLFFLPVYALLTRNGCASFKKVTVFSRAWEYND